MKERRIFFQNFSKCRKFHVGKKIGIFLTHQKVWQVLSIGRKIGILSTRREKGGVLLFGICIHLEIALLVQLYSCKNRIGDQNI